MGFRKWWWWWCFWWWYGGECVGKFGSFCRWHSVVSVILLLLLLLLVQVVGMVAQSIEDVKMANHQPFLRHHHHHHRHSNVSSFTGSLLLFVYFNIITFGISNPEVEKWINVEKTKSEGN